MKKLFILGTLFISTFALASCGEGGEKPFREITDLEASKIINQFEKGDITSFYSISESDNEYLYQGYERTKVKTNEEIMFDRDAKYGFSSSTSIADKRQSYDRMFSSSASLSEVCALSDSKYSIASLIYEESSFTDEVNKVEGGQDAYDLVMDAFILSTDSLHYEEVGKHLYDDPKFEYNDETLKIVAGVTPGFLGEIGSFITYSEIEGTCEISFNHQGYITSFLLDMEYCMYFDFSSVGENVIPGKPAKFFYDVKIEGNASYKYNEEIDTSVKFDEAKKKIDKVYATRT